MNSRHTPPTIVLVMEPPELLPPSQEEVGSIEEVVEVDVVVGESVGEVKVEEVEVEEAEKKEVETEMEEVEVEEVEVEKEEAETEIEELETEMEEVETEMEEIETEMDEVEEVEVEVDEVEVEVDTTDESGGVTSGSLPAAFASVGSNVPFYTYPMKHNKFSIGQVHLLRTNL